MLGKCLCIWESFSQIGDYLCSSILQAKRYANDLTNAVWTNQFDNTANRRAHIEMTGPEIWEQTDGKVDAVTFSTGTGGTLAG